MIVAAPTLAKKDRPTRVEFDSHCNDGKQRRQQKERDRVRLAGYVANPWTEYNSEKVFVSSALSELFGNVAVEALAHGLPVVAVASTGPRHILANGEFGRLVPSGDTKALADAINTALNDPGDPHKRAGRAQIFSVEIRTRVYEDLIHELLTGEQQSADMLADAEARANSISV